MSSRRLTRMNGFGLAAALTVYFSDGPPLVIVAIHCLVASLLTLWIWQNRTTRAGLVGVIAAGLWTVAQVPRLFGDLGQHLKIPLGFTFLIAIVLTTVAFSVLQHRQLPAHTRLPNTIQGIQLGLTILALEWFLFVQQSIEDNFSGLPTFGQGLGLLLAQTVTILPVVSSALFFMHSATQRWSLFWAMVGTAGLAIFIVAIFHAALYGFLPITPGWELFAIAGVTSYSLSLESLNQRKPEKPTLLLPLIPNLLGAVTIVVGIIHAAMTGVDIVDLSVIAVVALALIASQTYFYVDQQKLLTVIQEQENQVRHLVMHDGLTGLANRTLFQDRLSHAIAMRQRDNGHLSLILLNINGFKEINEQYGHALGDEILLQIGKRLSTWVRPTDTVARLAGDEFAVLMETDDQAAFRIAERLQIELSRPFNLASSQLNLKMSMGVTSIQPSAHQELTATELSEFAVNQADAAMYQARNEGSFIVMNV